MKYSELEKKLRKIGCYPVGGNQGGHPLWYSPLTNKMFQMSHHQSHEVATKTLIKIKKVSGL
ncbi:MAG: type II toxin-antitoxin system HicA family toxin [Bacteroidales bacterium]|nr:type II toxin-antitoxin system HicA family toxin [Bacteroidales bacterium]